MFVWKDDSIMSMITELLRIKFPWIRYKIFACNMQKVLQINRIFPVRNMIHSEKCDKNCATEIH